MMAEPQAELHSPVVKRSEIIADAKNSHWRKCQQSEEPCWFSNVNSIIIIIITYKKRWRWTWYPGPFKCSAKVPRKIRDSRCVCCPNNMCRWIGATRPDLRAHTSQLLLAVFHVITFSRSYFAYFLWKKCFFNKNETASGQQKSDLYKYIFLKSESWFPNYLTCKRVCE